MKSEKCRTQKIATSRRVGTGDVNADGICDIFIRNEGGKVVVYFLKDTGALAGYRTVFTNAAYEVVP